jgi:hypothetical protein
MDTREIKYPWQTKTSAAALLFDTGISRARERKPQPKITWSSRLVQQASPLLIGKRNLLKSPLEILWIDATYDNISYVRGLYD